MSTKRDKRPLNAIDFYLEQLGPKDYVAIEQIAYYIMEQATVQNLKNPDYVPRVWSEAVINILLRKGLMRPEK
jgi:hypothetical protein